MEWEKIGKIFEPKGDGPDWMNSHAANPVPFMLNDKVVRVFFSCRDVNNYSSIGYVDIDFTQNFKIVKISEEPVLSPGLPGFFDDNGCSVSWVIEDGGKFLLYYLGWNLRRTVPWLNTIGLATSNSIDGPFVKYSKVPIMDRSIEDPFTVSYPCVIEDGGIFKMWYGSNLAWGSSAEDMAHVIKYAESADGIHWKRSNQVHIPLMHIGEYAISKPCVVKLQSGDYRIWYSYRACKASPFYRIGTAYSVDGMVWKREDDKVGIGISETGWDSVAISYPNVFEFEGHYYMLYNGNEYGKTGFGLARLVTPIS